MKNFKTVPHEIYICPPPFLSMQYRLIHFHTLMIHVSLYNHATRGDFLPSLQPPISVFAVVAPSDAHCQYIWHVFII